MLLATARVSQSLCTYLSKIIVRVTDSKCFNMSLGHNVLECKYCYVSVVSKGQLCYAYTLGNYQDNDVLSNSGFSKLFLFQSNVFIVLIACVKKVNSNAIENPVIGIAYNALDLFNQTPSLLILENTTTL